MGATATKPEVIKYKPPKLSDAAEKSACGGFVADTIVDQKVDGTEAYLVRDQMNDEEKLFARGRKVIAKAKQVYEDKHGEGGRGRKQTHSRRSTARSPESIRPCTSRTPFRIPTGRPMILGYVHVSCDIVS